MTSPTGIRRRFLFIAAILCCLPVCARTIEIPDSIDFGTIRETDGPKTVRFYVRNVGDEPASILNVRPTCGCTGARFQEEEFAPGDSAWIELTYDPARRPGSFSKSVRILPVGGGMLRLPICGRVVASPETVGLMFPVEAGLLNLSEKTVMGTSTLKDREEPFWVDTYNTRDYPVDIILETDSEAVRAYPYPYTLQPGDRGSIGIYVDPRKESRKGRVGYTVRLLTVPKGGRPDNDATEISLFTEIE